MGHFHWSWRICLWVSQKFIFIWRFTVLFSWHRPLLCWQEDVHSSDQVWRHHTILRHQGTVPPLSIQSHPSHSYLSADSSSLLHRHHFHHPRQLHGHDQEGEWVDHVDRNGEQMSPKTKFGISLLIRCSHASTLTSLQLNFCLAASALTSSPTCGTHGTGWTSWWWGCRTSPWWWTWASSGPSGRSGCLGLSNL